MAFLNNPNAAVDTEEQPEIEDKDSIFGKPKDSLAES